MQKQAQSFYCIDLPQKPDIEWLNEKETVESLELQIDNKERRRGRMEYVRGDVTDHEQMKKIVEKIMHEQGRLDICVACAGILHDGDSIEFPPEEFTKTMNVNVHGVFNTAQAARHVMKRGGSIILIASMSGSIANKGLRWVAYNSSKAAVIQMGRSLACELGGEGIRVNTISPGYISTKMVESFMSKNPRLQQELPAQNPMGRLGKPDEMRGVALWLAGEGSTFCTGSDIRVDGGHSAW